MWLVTGSRRTASDGYMAAVSDPSPSIQLLAVGRQRRIHFHFGILPGMLTQTATMRCNPSASPPIYIVRASALSHARARRLQHPCSSTALRTHVWERHTCMRHGTYTLSDLHAPPATLPAPTS